MPTQDEIFKKICNLVKEGAADMPLGPDVEGTLSGRYFAWIVTPGKNKDGSAAPTPQEVWEQKQGADLRGKFKEIGKKAGKKSKDKGKDTVGGKETLEEALVVEADSDCPWCL